MIETQFVDGQKHKLTDVFHGDSDAVVIDGDVISICKNLPSEMFSLIVTSPPYNIGKSYEKQVELERYIDWQREVIRELVRLLAPDGSICWQVGNYVEDGEVFPLDIQFYPIFKDLKLKLRNRVIWHFEHGLHASKRLSGRYETLLWFTKTDDYIFNLDSIRIPAKYPGKRHFKGEKYGQPSGNPLGKNPSDFWIEQRMREDWESLVWDIPNVKNNHCEKTVHPCQFPVELIERCVLAFTDPQDWVLDPYGGVGSTAIAALRHGRRAVSVDNSQDYSEVARQRIESLFAGKLRTRLPGTPIHKPSGKVAQLPEEWRLAINSNGHQTLELGNNPDDH